VPILKSLIKVKDVRSVITKIINKMADNYSEMNRLIYEDYQNHKHINPKHRGMHFKLTGNYHKSLNDYNPIKMLEKYPNELDVHSSGDNNEFNKLEVDVFLFNFLVKNFSTIEGFPKVPIT
jgi:hypothetical protein